ncbi:MAG: DUF6783 domain-containing protein [Lachnospiraceae bacterium]
MYVTICGRFYLHESGAAGCVSRMRTKFCAKWACRLQESFFKHALKFLQTKKGRNRQSSLSLENIFLFLMDIS